MEAIELVLADASPVVISGFRSFFENHRRVVIVAHTHRLDSLLAIVVPRAPAVAIVDWSLAAALPGAASEIVHKLCAHTRLIFSGMPDSLAERRHALRLGARGFLSRQHTERDVIHAVLRVANGNIYLGDMSAEDLLHLEFPRTGRGETTAARPEALTPRERDIVRLVCRGLKNRGIAESLRISETTVCHHLTAVYSKLLVPDRTSLVIYAYRHGLEHGRAPAPEPGREHGSRAEPLPFLRSPVAPAHPAARAQPVHANAAAGAEGSGLP